MHKHCMMLTLLILINSTLSLAQIIFSQYSDEKIFDLFLLFNCSKNTNLMSFLQPINILGEI